ncbi:XRE family transcriptional regulator [Mycobacterium szulgai]|uniref:XRE family transcriptional regulator n=1 Tax=Mycobacterium szulgai TaxID=1787 RepID=UPI00111BD18F|nr:XRE family transcriptional regulator [Mycobacterium szulgai]MCV7076033.1 XRE family transcriptional regulator [Mycobacterium szulgai]
MTSTLADRLNKLFAVMHRAGEPPLSNAAATEAMTRRSGVSFSHNDLEQWRAGMRIDATSEQLEAIAKFFGVPTVYLTDPTDEVVDAQLNVLRAMRDSGGVVQCHRTAKPLTPQVLNSLAEVIYRACEIS